MGVDLETYRGRIGTYRHSCGQDVITVTCVISFSSGLKTIGAVLFICVLLLIAGIESNPGPDGAYSSFLYIAIAVVITGLLVQIIEWKLADSSNSNNEDKPQVPPPANPMSSDENISPEQSEDKMYTMAHQRHLENTKYRQWVKAGLGLTYLREGIAPFCEDIVKQQHNDILDNIKQKKNLSAVACGQCNWTTLRPDHAKGGNKSCTLGQKNCNCCNPAGKITCPHKVCGAIYDAVVTSHGSTPPAPYWKNTETQHWCTDPWSIAKCFINAPGYDKKAPAADIDCIGLLHLIRNNQYFHNHIQCTIAKTDVFLKVITDRNEIFHSSTMQLEETVTNNYIDDMIAVLQDGKELCRRQDAQNAVKKLLELKKNDFIITTQSEADVVKAAMQSVNDTIKDFENKLQEKLDNVPTTEYVESKLRENLENVPTKEDVTILELDLVAVKEEMKELKRAQYYQQNQYDSVKSKLEEENFIRMTLLILKCGMPLLRCFISHKAQEDGKVIDAILHGFKIEILDQLHEEMKAIVFPQNGSTDLELWDFSTITVVLLVAFKHSLRKDEKNAIKTIQSIRDSVFANPKTILLRNDCYERHKTDMKQAFETLLNKLDISEQYRFKTILNECKKGQLGEKQSIIQTIESQFQQLRADMMKTIRDEYKKSVTEGKVMKEFKVLGIDVAVCGEDKDMRMVELVQKTILKMFNNKAVKRCETSDLRNLEKAVDDVLNSINDMENVKVIGAVTGSIILNIEVSTNEALLDTLEYIEGGSMNKKLEAVTNELVESRLLKPSCSLSAAVSQDTLRTVYNECKYAASQREENKSQLKVPPTTASSLHQSETSNLETGKPLPEQHDAMSDTREAVRRGFAKAKDEIPGFEYDVFLVFKSNTADEKKVRKIASELDKKGLSCESHEAFTPGCPVVTNIVKHIENSKTTLLLLSKQSKDSSWILLETILALEQSTRSDRLTLKIVLEGVCESDVKFLKKDLLASIPHFQLDFSDESWSDQLATYVKEEVKLPDILPVGSLAHGLVFSHFIGFYRYVLPELTKLLPENEVYKRNPGRVSTKYYLLIPSSCKILNTLETVDKKNKIAINRASSLDFKLSHSGKPREYCIPVYSIQKEGEEPYYFFADTPNVLNAIYRMENEGLAKVDTRFQVARFYHTMNEVVNHSLNQPCNDVVELLPYNDQNESMHKILLDAIKHHLDTNAVVTERIPHMFMDPKEKRQKNDVTILCLPDEKEDCEIANNIAECLRAKGISVCTDIGIQSENFSEMKIPQANWYIFVISKSTLEFDNPLAFKCIACLHESVCENSLCVLPVTVKVKPHEIPALIRWVTLVSAEEPNYLDVILQTIQGKPVKMKHRIPCGDVATGLAWANYINYLSVTLKPGLQERIEDVLKREKIECYCIEKLFIIVPWSCKAEEKLHDAANDGCPEPLIEYVGPTKVLEVAMAGQKRSFYLHMYKYTNPETKESICFLAEYSAAINCLFEMSQLQFAGMTNADMKKQCEDFVRVMKDIMSRQTVKDKLGDISSLVEFVYYGDDPAQSLLRAIQKQIVGNNEHRMVYADGNRETEAMDCS